VTLPVTFASSGNPARFVAAELALYRKLPSILVSAGKDTVANPGSSKVLMVSPLTNEAVEFPSPYPIIFKPGARKLVVGGEMPSTYNIPSTLSRPGGSVKFSGEVKFSVEVVTTPSEI